MQLLSLELHIQDREDSKISTELGVSDSLDDSCSTKEQSIKSASGLGGALLAWIGTKRPKMRAGKKIVSWKGVDHI